MCVSVWLHEDFLRFKNASERLGDCLTGRSDLRCGVTTTRRGRVCLDWTVCVTKFHSPADYTCSASLAPTTPPPTDPKTTGHQSSQTLRTQCWPYYFFEITHDHSFQLIPKPSDRSYRVLFEMALQISAPKKWEKTFCNGSYKKTLWKGIFLLVWKRYFQQLPFKSGAVERIMGVAGVVVVVALVNIILAVEVRIWQVSLYIEVCLIFDSAWCLA